MKKYFLIGTCAVAICFSNSCLASEKQDINKLITLEEETAHEMIKNYTSAYVFKMALKSVNPISEDILSYLETVREMLIK